ncbi:hypothetical protein BE20_15410 [Sorangium cellulosum]|nr:hypothetical protein BE20_15410 [Sorangium cellulosum]
MSSAWSASAPGALLPRRLVSTRCSAPLFASHRATCAPSAPVPPVTSTVPAGANARAGAASPIFARTSLRA